MNYKIIGVDHKEYGPITAELVRQWIQERRLSSMSLAQAEGSGEWKPLSLFAEFQAALASVMPPPPAASWTAVPSGPPQTNSLAVFGLIMGIITVTCGSCCCYGFPFNVLGVVCSAIAISQINANPQLERGKGMAIAGLALSILGTLFAIGLLAFWALAAGLSHRPSTFHFI